MKRVITITLTLLLPLMATACNTMEGLGQDVQKGGKNLERSADRHGGNGR
jgi:predicted small secreted protein